MAHEDFKVDGARVIGMVDSTEGGLHNDNDDQQREREKAHQDNYILPCLWALRALKRRVPGEADFA